MGENSTWIKRYTNLASALDILKNGRLLLLDTDKWDDQDDAFFMREYRRRLNCGPVKELCFTTSAETYHHWRIYSHGNDGVCFEFDTAALVESAKTSVPPIECRTVKYYSIDEIERTPPGIADWPFIKRKPYEGEGEFRMVSRCASEADTPTVSIDASSIYRIKLSPWLDEALVQPVAEVLGSTVAGQGVPIYRSRLINYGRWRKAVGALPADPAEAE